MDKKNSVDDILEEIKRKKLERQQISPQEYLKSLDESKVTGKPATNFDEVEKVKEYVPKIKKIEEREEKYYKSEFKADNGLRESNYTFHGYEEPQKNNEEEKNLKLREEIEREERLRLEKIYEEKLREERLKEEKLREENQRLEKLYEEKLREERRLSRFEAEEKEKRFTEKNENSREEPQNSEDKFTEIYENKKISPIPASIAQAFGNQAYKPYENKSYNELREKHRKKFLTNEQRESQKEETERINSLKSFPENNEEKISEEKSKKRFYKEEALEEKPKKLYEETSAEKPDKLREEAVTEENHGEKVPFKVNLKDNFFDKDDNENTQMDIPVNSMDSSKAAMGFTRNITDSELDEDQKKKRKFSFGSVERDKNDSLEDYNSPADKDTIAESIRKSGVINLVQIIITLVIFGVLAYWGVSLHNVKLPLPGFMLPEKSMQIFMGMNLAFLIVNALVCNNVIGEGIISLFTLKPDMNTPAALATIACVIQGAFLTMVPEKVTEDVNIYFGLASLSILFTLLGKMFMNNRIKRNFNFLNSDGEKYTLDTIQSKALCRELTRGQNIEEPEIAYSSKTKFPTEFLQISNSEDYSENISKITIPLFLGFSVLVSIITYFFGGDHNYMFSLTVFSAMMCICAPLTCAFVANIPLNMMSKALTKNGAMAAGYRSLEDMDEVSTIAIDANDLFAGGTIVMHGIKTFSNSRVDNAIIDAASVACSSSGILMDIFMEMIQHKTSLLKKVDSVIYEDKMGISAWVEGKKVLIGNRNLMLNHEITPPDISYENKFKQDGREIIYLANSGELTAMFVVSYTGSDEMVEYLDDLASKGISLTVYTTDPNITANKIEELFDYTSDMVTIISSKNHAEFNEISCDKERAPAKVVYDGTLTAKIRAVCGVINAKSAVVLGTILQLVTVVLGYGLITCLAFMGQMGMAKFEILLAYQVVSALLVIIIPNIKKY